MLLVVAVLGMATTQAQDIFVSGGHLQALHIGGGDDIEQGASINVGIDFDIFKKSKFNFGPSLVVNGFTSAGEDIDATTVFGAGLTTGFDLGRFTFKSGLNYTIPVVEKGRDLLFYSVSTSALQYKLKKDGKLAIQAGLDYMFNRNFNYYTYQPTLGLSLKF